MAKSFPATQVTIGSGCCAALLTWTFCFCFSLDLAAEALLAMMRFARLGSTLASGAGARWRPPLPLRLGGDAGSASVIASAAIEKRVTYLSERFARAPGGRLLVKEYAQLIDLQHSFTSGGNSLPNSLATWNFQEPQACYKCAIYLGVQILSCLALGEARSHGVAARLTSAVILWLGNDAAGVKGGRPNRMDLMRRQHCAASKVRGMRVGVPILGAGPCPLHVVRPAEHAQALSP